MADSTLAALTAATALDGDELVYVVDDPSGTPADRKVTAKLLSGFGLIAETTLGADAASLVFSSIPSVYSHLFLAFEGRTARANNADDLGVRLNADVTAGNHLSSYIHNAASLTGTTSSAGTSIYIGSLAAASSAAGLTGAGHLWVPNYAGTSRRKVINGQALGNTGLTPSLHNTVIAGVWLSTAAVTSLTILSQTASNLLAGFKATLYGMRSA